MRSTLALIVALSGALPVPVAAGDVELVVARGHRGGVAAIAWSPDGRVVATGGFDGRTKLWDAQSGRMLRELPSPRGRVTGLAFSNDVLVVGQVNARAFVFDRKKGKWTHAVDFDQGGYCGVAVSSDGKRFACGGDRFVGVYDVATGREIVKIKGPRKDRFYAVALNSDGTELAAASDEKTVYVWRTEDGRQVRDFRDHDGQVRGLSWPKAAELVSIDTKGSVRSWNRATRAARTLLTGRQGDYGVFAASGDLVASVVDGAAVVTGAGGDEVARITGRVPTAVVFDPKRGRLAIGSDDGEVWIHELASGRRVARLHGLSAIPRAVAATAKGGLRVLVSERGAPLTVVDLATRKQVWSLGKPLAKRTWGALDPGGTHIAYGAKGEGVIVTSLATGERVPFPAAVRANGPLALSRGATRLACTQSWERIAVFDRGADGARATVPGDQYRGVLGVAFDESGESILFGGKGNLVRLVEIANKKTEVEQGGHGSYVQGDPTPPHDRGMGWVRSLAVSPDGTRVLCGGPYVYAVLRKRKDLESLAVLKAHYGSVVAAAFSADGNRLITVGSEGMLKCWDASGNLLLTVHFVAGGNSVAIAPDGRWDATAGAAKTCRWLSDNEVTPLASRADRKVEGLVAEVMSVTGEK